MPTFYRPELQQSKILSVTTAASTLVHHVDSPRVPSFTAITPSISTLNVFPNPRERNGAVVAGECDAGVGRFRSFFREFGICVAVFRESYVIARSTARSVRFSSSHYNLLETSVQQ